jgi:hypothetical protein
MRTQKWSWSAIGFAGGKRRSSGRIVGYSYLTRLWKCVFLARVPNSNRRVRCYTSDWIISECTLIREKSREAVSRRRRRSLLRVPDYMTSGPREHKSVGLIFLEAVYKSFRLVPCL